MARCHVIKTFVFNLNFRDEITIPILTAGISLLGVAVLVIFILYANRRKKNPLRGELIFCVNYLCCQAHWFSITNKQRALYMTK